MLTKRIIAALDIKEGRTVKGIQFQNMRDAGDPIELGKRYSEDGIDELVFLDITASQEKRKIFVDLVRNIAREIAIPFTVGGGISSIDDVSVLLNAGADKVFINSAAVKKPENITALAKEFGSQCIVVAIDAKEGSAQNWGVFINGGKTPTDRELFSWGREVVDRGAGEILFTSMSHDGAKRGYACEATRKLATSLPVPVIASGGAGSKEHFEEIFTEGRADAALAATVFHFDEIPVKSLKRYLAEKGVPVRL